MKMSGIIKNNLNIIFRKRKEIENKVNLCRI